VEVWTDGSILPSDSVAVAAKILRGSLQPLHPLRGADREEVEEEVDEELVRIRKLLNKSVDELELSVRSSNCLRAAEIKSIGDLVQKGEPEMLKFRNFGRKSLKEIQDILGEMGLHFGMDISRYREGHPLMEAER
jgi:DNA-directed RNA polymerase subunit alpha